MLALTCLSHMVLSPVGLQQIGKEQRHMAAAARPGAAAFAVSCHFLSLLNPSLLSHCLQSPVLPSLALLTSFTSL